MKDPTKPTLREWSSLIGIITAIVGNILISLALNIQRYAHVRLRRQSNYHLATSTRNASERSAARDRQVQPKIGAQVAVYQGAEARHAVDRQHQLHVEISKAEERTRSSDTVGDGRYGVSPPTRLNIQRYAALEYTELTETPTYNIKFRTDENASPLEGRSGGRTGPASNHQSTPDEMTPLMRAGQSSSPAQPIIRDSDDSSSEDLPKSYLKSPYWWLGFILMVVGEAGNFLAYGFAPASIVSPLGVVALVSNCVIAPVMLKEPFRRQDLLGVLVSVAGTATVVSSANPSESKMGPDAIWEAITRLEFEVYLGITCFLIVALACASPSYGHKSVLLDLGIVALAGGYTALSTKGVASLVSDTLWRVPTFRITYVLVAVLIFTAFLQVRYLNKALQRFDSTQVIPTQFVMFNISVIVGSAVLYQDFKSATLEQILRFVGGCGLTFAGVFAISSGRVSAEAHETIQTDEENDTGLEREQIGTDNVLEGNRKDVQANVDTVYSPHLSHLEPMAYPIDQKQSSRSFAQLPFEDPGAQASGGTAPASPPSKHEEVDQNIDCKRLSRSSTHPPLESPRKTHRRLKSEDHSTYFSIVSTSPRGSSARCDSWATARERSDRSPRRVSMESTTSSEIFSFNSLNVRLPAEEELETATLTPSKMSRPSTLSRRSMSRLMPGPLASPLSSSLSAVVAESLRRGMDTPTKSGRFRRSELRRTQSERTENLDSQQARWDNPQGSSSSGSHRQHKDSSDEAGVCDRTGSSTTWWMFPFSRPRAGSNNVNPNVAN